MSYSSLSDYHRQRAASSASSLKRRAQTWFYEETESKQTSWADWADEELLDADAYDTSGYSASDSLGSYWKFRSTDSSKATEAEQMSRALKSVARSCNAIRATVGRGKDLSLRVKWSNGYEGNNVKQNDVIILSPDTVLRKEVKSEWTEGKRSDALVGDALTAAAQKRTIQTKVVAESLTSTDPDAPLARVLWSAVETDVAQNALLNDYKGAAVYFAASNAFHSSDEYRTSIEQTVAAETETKSEPATAALAWNILHQKKLELPEDVKLATQTAMREFASAKTCGDRWNASLRAVKILRKLDQPKPQNEQEESGDPEQSPCNGGQGGGGQEPQDSSNGNPAPSDGTESPDQAPAPSEGQGGGQSILKNFNGRAGLSELIGDSVSNEENAPVSEAATDVEDLSEDANDTLDATSSLRQQCKRTRFVDRTTLEPALAPFAKPSTKALLAGYEGVVRRLSSLVNTFSQVNTFESYGRYSGQLDTAKLWAVPSGSADVFVRRDEAGEKPELSVAVLVDISGSTGICSDSHDWARPADTSLEDRIQFLNREDAYGEKGSQRISVALKRSATILSEAIRASGSGSTVRVHVYAHQCGEVFYYGTTSNIVIENRGGGGTDEAEAVSKTALHFLEQEADRDCRKVLICCGDGQTNAASLKRTVESATKLGLEVYSVLVANGSPEYFRRHGEFVFGKGRFAALAASQSGKLTSMLTSFVTRILNRASK